MQLSSAAGSTLSRFMTNSWLHSVELSLMCPTALPLASTKGLPMATHFTFPGSSGHGASVRPANVKQR